MKDSRTKSDYYEPNNLMKYHTALSVVDNMAKNGFISDSDTKKIYTVIAKKYGINSDSIFAV